MCFRSSNMSCSSMLLLLMSSYLLDKNTDLLRADVLCNKRRIKSLDLHFEIILEKNGPVNEYNNNKICFCFFMDQILPLFYNKVVISFWNWSQLKYHIHVLFEHSCLFNLWINSKQLRPNLVNWEILVEWILTIHKSIFFFPNIPKCRNYLQWLIGTLYVKTDLRKVFFLNSRCSKNLENLFSYFFEHSITIIHFAPLLHALFIFKILKYFWLKISFGLFISKPVY